MKEYKLCFSKVFSFFLYHKIFPKIQAFEVIYFSKICNFEGSRNYLNALEKENRFLRDLFLLLQISDFPDIGIDIRNN